MGRHPPAASAAAKVPVEELFRRLVETTTEYAIFVLDKEGVVASWNAGAQRLKGWTSEEIVGRHFSIFYSPEDVAAGKPARQLELAAARGMQRDEGWRLRKDGSRFWASVVITSLRDGKGKLLGFSKITQDLTERRKREAKFQSLLEGAPDAMLLVDRKGKIELLNAQAEKIFGYGRLELLGRPIEVLIPKRFRASHPALRERYGRDPRTRSMGAGLELFGLRKDGTEFPAEISLSPMAGEEGLMVTAAVRDVTDRVEAQNKIRELNVGLLRRTVALTAANEDLDAFSSSVAHDLRGPIQRILGFAQLLSEEYGPALDDKARQRLVRIQGNAAHMGRLVEGLLKLSKTTRRKVALELVPLGPLARSVVEELRSGASERDVEWKLGELFEAHCDPTLTKEVFENLLANALKFTRRAERAVIEVGAEATASGERAVFVRDNGVGFDMRQASKLFGVFSRLHPASDFEGTGVGLATVQRIVRKHGGRVWASAEPDKGATFRFTLAPPPDQETAEPQGAGSKT